MACDAEAQGIEAVPGAGLTALVEGRTVVAGTAALLASKAGVTGSEVAAAQEAIDAEGEPRGLGALQEVGTRAGMQASGRDQGGAGRRDSRPE